jgi:hypothetical protein
VNEKDSSAPNVIVDPVLLPTPVAVHTQTEPRINQITKFLSWLTGALLAAAVLVALIGVQSERGSLRDVVDRQSNEIACRSAAAFKVTEASADRAIASSEHDALLDDVLLLSIRNSIEPIDPEIRETQARELLLQIEASQIVVRDSGAELQAAIDEYRLAQTTCRDE